MAKRKSKSVWMRVKQSPGVPAGHTSLRLTMADGSQESLPVQVGVWVQVSPEIQRVIVDPDPVKEPHLEVNAPLRNLVEFADEQPKED